MTHRITKCRICGNEKLSVILDLGEQTLSGIFPDKPELEHKSPLRLVKCDEKHSDGVQFPCGHVQMEYTFTPEIMYGEDYGYRSGLNNSMVKHLKGRVDEIISRFDSNNRVSLQDGDIVLDIAGNDGTTLGFYPQTLRKINIDPTSEKFKKYQPEGVEIVPKFFDGFAYASAVGENYKPAKVITAFSMFYDIEDPREFLRDVKSTLDPNGLVVFEQSYLPLMFKRLAYDTVCHEHLSYFSLRQFQYLFKDVGLKIVDISFNDCNGGSFVITGANSESLVWEECSDLIRKVQDEEFLGQYHTLPVWEKWSEMIEQSRDQLKEIIAGKKVAALGASTKGNVVLQYCGLGPDDVEVVGDVNPDKNGCYTPGTWIPITDEETVLAGDYDYYLVLPWHFKEFFVNNPKFKGKTLLFPLPEVHTVTVE